MTVRRETPRTASGARRCGYAVLSLLLLGAVPASAAPGAPDDTGPPAGRTVFVGTGTAPAVSADGRYVAFQEEQITPTAAAQSPARYRIAVRDLVTGRTTRLPADRDRTAPTISGDGRLVGFTENDPLADAGSLHVADRTTGVVHQVTGTDSDLTYQRTPRCTPGEDGDIAGCGAVLSADGRTVAFPADLAVPSPYLTATADEEPGGAPWPGSLLDFGSVDGPVGTAYRTTHLTVGTVDGRAESIDARIVGSDAFRFGAPDTTSRRGPAPAVTRTASCAVPAGGTCRLTLTYAPDTGCATRTATLVLDADTPAGRTAYSLVGDAFGACAGPPSETASACPPPSGDTGTSTAYPAPDTMGVPAVDVGDVEPGAPRTVSLVVRNRDDAGPALLSFTGADCALVLTTRPDGDPDEPPACRDGDTLAAGQACTAYIRADPARVAPYVSSLTLRSEQTALAAQPVVRYRFVVRGRRHVVLVRRDPTGTGDFAGPGRPAPVVVPVSGAGDLLSGAEPALSADGRHVAFTAVGRPPGADGPRSQVYVHDTDADGDGSHRPGRTVLVSYLPGTTRRLPSVAGQPSLSADGRRVAFTGQGPSSETDQVYVRDLTTGHTVLVSTSADGTVGADGASDQPSLAADGSTLVWRSEATDLVDADPGGGSAPAEYARNLTPGLATPRRTELVSTRSAGTDSAELGPPVVSGDGAVVAFDSTAEPAGDTGGRSVSARIRAPRPSTDPAAVAFGDQPPGTTSMPAVVTMHNDGPGPLHLGHDTTGPFLVPAGGDGCTGRTVHEGESCTLAVVFTPSEPGQRHGTLILAPALPAAGSMPPTVVPLTGTGTPGRLAVSPRELAFPASVLGIGGPPLTVTVTNTGETPLPVRAAISPDLGDPDVFGVSPGTCATPVPAGGSCVLRVTAVPTGLAPATGALTVEADGTAGLIVPVRAVARRPVLSVSPAVVRPGSVTTVSGRYFPPGVPVTLAWTPGTAGTGRVTVRPDRHGDLASELLVFADATAGTRTVRATVPEVGALAGPPVLVQAASSQPSGFVTRR